MQKINLFFLMAKNVIHAKNNLSLKIAKNKSISFKIKQEQTIHIAYFFKI